VSNAAADELRRIALGSRDALLALDNSDVDASRGSEAWTKRQILGHLIDSTAANHQRFVRAQFTDELRFPSYDAPGWVVVQHYEVASWPLLVELWVSYAQLLAHILDVMPADQLQTPCWVDWFGEPQAITLERVVGSYIEHVEHHLGQLLAGAAA
jgi:hypothetical protein